MSYVPTIKMEGHWYNFRDPKSNMQHFALKTTAIGWVTGNR